MKVYNTASKEKDEFVSIVPGKVGMYVCGPTVYDFCHMGHARAYVAFDIIRRYLEHSGFDVNYVQNFTDVDDKIINRANEREIPYNELAETYIQEYFRDMDAMNVKRATVYPKATETISEMMDLVKGLIEKGYAYVVNGSVYFAIYKAFDRFGTLVHQDLKDMLDGARVVINDEKDHPKDFALWKKAKEGEPYWDSPWGKGRPGWHIECSAMSMKHIGNTLDIHGGGRDLIFPHHESEVLQSECFTGEKFVNYWLHNGFITIDQEKMSKSLGNFFTIREVMKKFDPMSIRFFFIHTHYRSPIDYNVDGLNEATKTLDRLKTTIRLIKEYFAEEGIPETGEMDLALEKARVSYYEKFIHDMDDDFNTRGALSQIFGFTRLLNSAVTRKKASIQCLRETYDVFSRMLSVLGLEPDMLLSSKPFKEEGGEVDTGLRDNLLDLLVEVRSKLRDAKLFQVSDMVRDRLNELGFVIEDKGKETNWRGK